MEKKKVRLSELLPIMEETLRAGGTVRLPITGTSMLPLLVEGRDTVTLQKAQKALQKNDLPLYRRKDGAFVLHRVVGVNDDGTYTMCGDNQWVKEPGIAQEQIIGVVAQITRKGKTFPVGAAKYTCYVRVWQMLFPVRKFLIRLGGKLRKIQYTRRKAGKCG